MDEQTIERMTDDAINIRRLPWMIEKTSDYKSLYDVVDCDGNIIAAHKIREQAELIVDGTIARLELATCRTALAFAETERRSAVATLTERLAKLRAVLEAPIGYDEDGVTELCVWCGRPKPDCKPDCQRQAALKETTP